MGPTGQSGADKGNRMYGDPEAEMCLACPFLCPLHFTEPSLVTEFLTKPNLCYSWNTVDEGLREEQEGRGEKQGSKATISTTGLQQQRCPSKATPGTAGPRRHPKATCWLTWHSVPPLFCGVRTGRRDRLGERCGTYFERWHRVERGGLSNQTDFHTVRDPYELYNLR